MRARLEPLMSSARITWSTPTWLRDQILSLWPIGLDAAAAAHTAIVPRYYDGAERGDGLSDPWDAPAVWCNPPYGRGIGAWIARGRQQQAEHGNRVIMLIPARPDTRAWHEQILGRAAVHFVRGRLRFDDGPNAAPFPSALIVFGDAPTVGAWPGAVP